MKNFNELWQSLQPLINLSITALPTVELCSGFRQIALTVPSMYSIKSRSMSHIPNSKSNTFEYCGKVCRNASSWMSRTEPLWSYIGRGLFLGFEGSET